MLDKERLQCIYNSINYYSLTIFENINFCIYFESIRIIFKILLKYFHEYINILNIHIFNLSFIQIIYLFQALAGSKYDDKHLMSNEVMEKTPSPLKSTYNSQSSRNSDCPPSSKPAMANRLLDWFSVVMADSKHRRPHPKPKGTSI